MLVRSGCKNNVTLKQDDNKCPWGVAPVRLTLSDGVHTLHAYLTPECAARDVPILSAHSENRLKWRLDQMTGATVRLVRNIFFFARSHFAIQCSFA
jgi:hypothetical protein